jgi:hypothetical protein
VFVKPRFEGESFSAIIAPTLPTSRRLGGSHVVDPLLDLRGHPDRLEPAAAGLAKSLQDRVVAAIKGVMNKRDA